MFRANVTKLFHDVILDPYTLKDLRLLIITARQDFINSVLNLRTLQLAKKEINPFSWIKARRIDSALLSTRSEIREKRLFLDDLERALEVATDNDRDEVERRDFYKNALEEKETEDQERYEKRLERLEEEIESNMNRLSEARFPEVGLLIEIRKQVAEIFLLMERTVYQNKRRLEWQLYGPPSRVDKDYEEFRRQYSQHSNATTFAGTSHEPENMNNRVLCTDGSCIGVIGDDGRCKVCGKRSSAGGPA